MNEDIKESQPYKMIVEFYGAREAARSKVKLINHINEGLVVLQELGASVDAQEAFCLHPMTQDDAEIKQNFAWVANTCRPAVVMLAMEYRSVANDYLSPKVWTAQKIRLSPLKEVNDMLIADKVQNRKDFITYHKGTHKNSDTLTVYFTQWLDALGVSEEQYQKLCEAIDAGKR
jgi:hypothetical protein